MNRRLIIALGGLLLASLATEARAQAGNLRFSLPEFAASEGDGTVTLQVDRLGGSAGTVSVDYFSFDLTTTAGLDWIPTFGTLSFGPGVTRRSISLPLLDDGQVEGVEELMVGLESPSGGVTVLSPQVALVLISDNDAPGARLSWGAAAYTVDEGAGSVLVSVERSGDSTAGASVGCWTTDWTASGDADYGDRVVSLDFDVGVTTQSFTIPVTQDALEEGDEVFLLHLGTPSGASPSGPVSVAVTIRDDDLGGPLSGNLRWSSSALTGGEDAGNVSLTVERVGGNAGAIGVSYSTHGLSATPHADYLPQGGILSWAHGDATPRTIAIGLVDDLLLELDETLELVLSDPTGGASIVGSNPALVTITSDESAGDPGDLRWSLPEYSVGEGAGNVVLTLERVGGSLGPVSVDVFAFGLSATEGQDWSPNGGRMTLAEGQTSLSLAVPILDDAAVEPIEDFMVGIVAPVGGAELLEPTLALVSLVDDDAPGQTLAFAAPAVSVVEGAGTVELTLLRAGGTTGEVSVGYWTSNHEAETGADFLGAPGGISLGDGVGTGVISIPIVSDALSEDAEVFLVHLGTPSGASLTGPMTIPVTILDDEPTDLFRFASPSLTPGEGDGLVSVPVERLQASGGAMSVDFATADGTALAGSDYQAAAGTLTWAAGETGPKSFSVLLLEDTLAEGVETLSLSLSNPQGGARIAGDNPATLSIADDDAGHALPIDVGRVYWIGASLVGHETPAYMGGIARDGVVSHVGNIQMIYGEALSHAWDFHDVWIDPPGFPFKYSAKVSDSHIELMSGAYDVLVLSEVTTWAQEPELATLIWRPTQHLEGGAGFYRMAYQANPATRFYVDANWFGNTGGWATWLQEILDYLPAWEAGADAIDALRGTTITSQPGLGGVPEPVIPPVDFPNGNPVHVIPSGLAFRELVIRVQAGQVPGIADPAELFDDPVHPSQLGTYFHGLVHYATIYRRSPVGIPATTGFTFYGEAMAAPAPATARAMQEIAWEVVRAYPRSGVMAPP